MNKKISVSEFLIKFLSTVFGLGFSPVVPGTMASLAGLLIYLVFIRGNQERLFIIVGVITAIGFFICGKAEKLFNQKDARPIIIDDFAGMLISLLFLPYSLTTGILAFLLFRVMDGLKPYPIYKIEHYPGGLGIMLDDILAGVYVNITLQLLRLTFAILS